jgi:pimeloyl-ACP methyl ester carboxylesterase
LVKVYLRTAEIMTGAEEGRQLTLSTPAISDRCVQADGVRIQFWQAGLGPAAVLVHGLLGYSFSWRGVITSLAQDRQVFAPDMPGAGFSECRADLDCSLLGAARRLLGFMDAAGIQSCDLIGSSYGGATAIILAGLIPSRIRSLVLVSPANPWSRVGRKRLALLRNPIIALLFPKVARAVHPVHRYFVRRMWGNPRLVTAETLDGYIRPLLQPGIFEHAVKTVRTWHADMRELEAALPKIAHVPTLLLWGSKDRVVDPASAERMAKHLPGARVVSLKGAGHLPYEECAEEFCRTVLDFLCDVSSADIARPAR